MKIAIFHHHLNRGGVTQVIANHLRAINAVVDDLGVDVFLFYGGRKSAWPENLTQQLQRVRVQEVIVEQLDYDEVLQQQSPDVDQLDLAANLIDALDTHGLSPNNCVLHFHNHNLGRNSQLTLQTVGQLAAAGFRMLLQIHDFAEDFRPQNYRKLTQQSAHSSANFANALYPSTSQVLFGVINRRDGDHLGRLGVDPARIKYLPNPVAAIAGITDQKVAKQKMARCCQRDYRPRFDPDLPFLVYPVRGIRRKNIGEAILMTLISNSPIQVGVTLPPLNPNESIAYEVWKSLAREFQLPVFLELGQVDGLDFTDIMSAADQILTTSVAEGFGMAFLEGLAIGKPLVGRDLPEITADFVAAGIEFPNLYTAVKIPVDAVSLADLRQGLVKLLTKFYRDYDRQFDVKMVDQIIARDIERGWIDFAKLTTELQFQVVRAAVADAEFREDLRKLNPRCSAALGWQSGDETDLDQLIESNRQCVTKSYSFSSVGDRILSSYRQLTEVQPESLPGLSGADSLVDVFLDPKKIFPIRFEILAVAQDQAPDHVHEFRELICQNSNQLLPVPTGVDPEIRRLDPIDVVLFDIYGTLLVSASGDIGTDDQSDGASRTNQADRLHQLLGEIGLDDQTARERIREEILQKHQSLRQFGIPYPEIDIVRIWETVIRRQLQSSDGRDSLASNALGWPSPKVRELAVRYEISSNPVYPMPGMIETLASLGAAGFRLGIISNAQFYTPITLEAFTQTSLDELGFDERFRWFSYRLGRAKPDVFLYEHAANALAELEIAPERVLYVGNDMTKDMVPAKSVGFKTALFAGDERSLRMGGHALPLPNQLIDVVLTELGQINHCLPDSSAD